MIEIGVIELTGGFSLCRRRLASRKVCGDRQNNKLGNKKRMSNKKTKFPSCTFHLTCDVFCEG